MITAVVRDWWRKVTLNDENQISEIMRGFQKLELESEQQRERLLIVEHWENSAKMRKITDTEQRNQETILWYRATTPHRNQLLNEAHSVHDSVWRRYMQYPEFVFLA